MHKFNKLLGMSLLCTENKMCEKAWRSDIFEAHAAKEIVSERQYQKKKVDWLCGGKDKEGTSADAVERKIRMGPSAEIVEALDRREYNEVTETKRESDMLA